MLELIPVAAAVQLAARSPAQCNLGDRTASATDIAQLPLIRCIGDGALRQFPKACRV